MREVDEALSRAYALRDASERATVPPPPHFDQGPASTRLEWPAMVRTIEQSYGDRFSRLADALLAARDQHHLKVLLFTSCHRAEGRSTLVLTVARALARKPGKTLLVDADLSGPMLARLLGLRPKVGLDDVVEGGQALADALIASPDDNLSVLPLRAAVARPKAFLASPAWSRTIARLRREFDLVLIDGSPMFTGLSAAVLHQSVDAAVLVHNRALSGERALLRAQEALEAGGVPLLGLAETFVS
jgi:capsular exopolysaccharide synthesis family protein